MKRSEMVQKINSAFHKEYFKKDPKGAYLNDSCDFADVALKACEDAGMMPPHIIVKRQIIFNDDKEILDISTYEWEPEDEK